MLPKIIHYCRFGKGPKPEKVQECFLSWKKYCPDYEIIERNEGNCDLNVNKRVKQSYKHKKRAFVSDYFRLKALYDKGGIYLDTDMELRKSLDFFINNDSFRGFDSRKILSGGIIGTNKKNQNIQEIINIYDNKKKFDGTTINSIITPYFEKKGLILNGLEQNLSETKFYQSNKISIDIGDGEAVVIDHHLNSRCEGRKVDNSSRVYAEFLAIKDEKLGKALDAIYQNYTESYIWKIGSFVIGTIERLGLMPVVSKIFNKFIKK